MQEWLAEQAAIARQKRAELYDRMKAEADAKDLTRARSVLASIPPPLPGGVRTFVKIHEAPAPSSKPDGEIQLIEGTVFDIYSVMTGGMGGDDDFLAFKVISNGDQMTSWRKGSIDLALGNVVQIKFVLIKSVISRGNDDDHIDDPILEVWVAKDQVEAVEWYRKAAEQNNAEAQFNLGICYDNGRGVTKDLVEAYKWYRKAAQQNYAKAQSNLGFCYDNGEGVAKDQVEAVKWYRKAAEQNYAQAQFNLGIHCASGEGVAKDQLEAVKWYRKAAEQNQAAAQFNLGIRYDGGNGVAKDPVEAAKWYRKAAEQNYAKAQFNLSVCYENSEGVAKDCVEAYKWRMLAARQGNEDAKKTMTILENKMTPEQIAEGQKLAGDFKPLDPEMQN